MSGRIQSLRGPGAALAMTGAAFGAGASVAAERAVGWEITQPLAIAQEYCPTGATSPIPGPIDLSIGNGERRTDFTIDGTYQGSDIDFMVKDPETGVYGQPEEKLVVKAGGTAVAQLVGATYVPGESVKLDIKWTKDKSTHPLDVPVNLVSGAPCEAPAPTTSTTPGEQPTQEPTPTTSRKTPERPNKKADKPARVKIDKTFTGAPRFLYRDGRIVVRNGDPVVRVSPGLSFDLNLRVSAPNDGDKIRGERVPVRVTDILPHMGSTALMYARNPRTGEYTVSRVGKRFTLREGAPAVTLRYRVAATPEAASPPREIENVACIEALGPDGGDRDCDSATYYDPFEAFRDNAVNVYDQIRR